MHRVFLSPSVPAVLDPVIDAFRSNATTLSGSSLTKVPEVRDVLSPPLRGGGLVGCQRAEEPWRHSHQRPGGASVFADAVRDDGAALWIETGRSWTNNGVLEPVIEATACPTVHHVAVAVRRLYNGQAAYERCEAFLDRVIAAGRLGLPFESLLLIGF